MTATNHALTGAVIAVAINKPIIALPIALLSHFALDSLPHWNYWFPGQRRFRRWVLFLEFGLSLTLLTTLSLISGTVEWWLVASCGLLAILPDMMWFPYLILGKNTPADGKNLLHRLRRFHLKIQWSETSWGLAIEMLWFATMLQIYLLIVN